MKKWIHATTDEIPYPTKDEITRLENDPSDQSVEDKYYDQCIDAIDKGLEDFEWDSDTTGITVFDYDDEEDESYVIGTLSNDYIKEIEINCLRRSTNWADFQNDLAESVRSAV